MTALVRFATDADEAVAGIGDAASVLIGGFGTRVHLPADRTARVSRVYTDRAVFVIDDRARDLLSLAC